MKQISNLFVASLALFLLIAEPALAQSIDLPRSRACYRASSMR
jgi:hypothetical protein